MNWNIGGNASFFTILSMGWWVFMKQVQLRDKDFLMYWGKELHTGQPLNVWYLKKI